jgi:large subunit ribosomal protein L19
MHFPRLKKVYQHKQARVLPIKPGMMLELHERVGEGDNTRIQKFKGLVIQVKKPKHPDGTFTIRGTVARMTVERIFPLSFPKFEKVLLLDQYRIRRAKINYIRDKVGKDAKMTSILNPELKETDLLTTALVYKLQETVKTQENPEENTTEQTEEKIPEENITEQAEEKTQETQEETEVQNTEEENQASTDVNETDKK